MTPTHIEIQFCSFIADGAFVTKDGEIGFVLALDPQDSECMDAMDVQAVTNRFKAAVRQFDERFHIYQYLIHHAGRFEHYMVVMKPLTVVTAARVAVEGLVRQFGDSLPARILGSGEAYAFFRELLNYDPRIADVPLKSAAHIDYYASDSPVEVYREYLRVGDVYAKVLTLKDPPQETKPDMLRALREIGVDYIIVTEWHPVDPQDIRDAIKTRTSHFHRSKYATNLFGSMITKFSSNEQAERPEHMQKDESATAMEWQLGELITDIETNGTQVGEFALTVILTGTTLDQVCASCHLAQKAMMQTGAVLYEERHNALSAWFAALPGGYKHQRRAIYLTNHNYADLSMIFTPDTGEVTNPYTAGVCLAVMRTRQGTPYFANLNYEDVGHALISGMIGAGKSYLCSYLLARACERYNPRVVIFDIGGSYRKLTADRGGSYMEVGGADMPSINPFSLPDTPDNRQFWFSFVKVLIESSGFRMLECDEVDLWEVIGGNTSLLDVVSRLKASLQPMLFRWCRGGQYGDLFDNESDTLTCARFQAFDFAALDRYPQIIEPMLFYILHRASEGVREAGLKIFMIDEAWKFMATPTTRAYIHQALKTWRKSNAWMWLATQSIGDLEQSEMLRTVAENCGSVVLLPNPRLDRDEYRKVFKLNEVELDHVESMVPKRESLWKPACGNSKIVILDESKD